MYVCKKCGETYHGNFGKCAKCGGDIVFNQPPAPQAALDHKSRDNFLSGTKVLIGLAFITILFTFALLLIPTDSTHQPQRAVSHSFNKRSGEIATLKDNALISLNEEVEKELSRYAIAKNSEAIARLIFNGRVAMAPAGFRVTIIKTGWESSYVEVMDGPGAGARGWLINSMMQ